MQHIVEYARFATLYAVNGGMLYSRRVYPTHFAYRPSFASPAVLIKRLSDTISATKTPRKRNGHKTASYNGRITVV